MSGRFKDLADIAAYFREYQWIMDHWYKALPGRILTMDYEDMVTNEDITRRRLIEWCGVADDMREDDIQQGLLSARHIGRWRDCDEFIEPLKRKLGK